MEGKNAEIMKMRRRFSEAMKNLKSTDLDDNAVEEKRRLLIKNPCEINCHKNKGKKNINCPRLK